MTASKFTHQAAATKTRVKAAVHKATAPCAEPLHDEPIVHSSIDEAMRRYSASAEELLRSLNAPSGQRTLAAIVVGIIVYASGVYCALRLIDLIVVGVLSLTGSTFLAFVGTVLAAFLLGFAAAWAGVRTYNFVLNVNLDSMRSAGHEVRVAAGKRVSLVRSWFQREPQYDNVGSC